MELPAVLEPEVDVLPSGPTPEEQTALARAVAQRHQQGKARRRLRDLTAEKYLVHVFGEGDSQWADLVNGTAVEIPHRVGGSLRYQDNVLRPMVENMIGFHTAIPFRALDEPTADRTARDLARLNTALANFTIQRQRLNRVFADALNIAAVYGHCPVHGQWRNDMASDPFNPLYDGSQGGDPRIRGFFDAWVGDPWDSVYNEGATRRSVHRWSYGRTLPLEMVQNAFAHVEGVEDLKGSRTLPSASRAQRIYNSWSQTGIDTHGTGAIHHLGSDGEELIALICEEWMPGVYREFPDGRLLVIALSGAAVTEKEDRSGRGQARLLHDGPLPGKRSSAVRVYSKDGTDDVLGDPYVKDLDALQIRYNQLATLEVERIRRFARTQMIAQAGSLEKDTNITRDNAIIYYSGMPPQFLTPPQGDIGISPAMNRVLDSLFRIGGWQAASRGEGTPGDAAAKVVALAKADDSVFGPVNRDFQATVCEFLGLGWALYREYGTEDDMLEAVGSDTAYLLDAWFSLESDRAPHYVLTQGNASPEARLQQNLSLVGAVGADGQPLMTTSQFHDLNPDPSLRPIVSETQRVRAVRPQAVNYLIRKVVEGFRANTPDLPPEWMEQAAVTLHQQLAEHPDTRMDYRVLRDDDPALHIDALSELTQDAGLDPLVRTIAEMRQDLYYEWQMMMAMGGAPPEVGGDMAALPPGEDGAAPVQGESPSPYAGTPTSDAFAGAAAEVPGLTQEAIAG